MKKIIYILLILSITSITLQAKASSHKTSVKSIKKPKKFISEWRKAQWRKERLAKKQALDKKQTKTKKTTIKKKRFISEWRKAQWRKERLAKKQALNKKQAKTKKTTIKKKRFISEWRKEQWRKERLAQKKKSKKSKKNIVVKKNSKPKTKYISEWRKAQWRKARLKQSTIKKSKWTKTKSQKKSKAKKLNTYQVQKLNKIYKKVAKKTDINKRALKKAFSYYKNNKQKKALSSKYIAIADYTKQARKKRLYIINLKNGAVYKHKVAHGKYSGKIGGKVRHSSNRRNSNMTPYGFFKVGSRVGRTKKKGYKYLAVKGLEKSNRKVGYPSRYGGRDIVVHPARYVARGGRSHGCFAICPQDRRRVFAKLKKALLYSYTGR